MSHLKLGHRKEKYMGEKSFDSLDFDKVDDATKRVNRLYESFYRVREKMEEQYMSVSKVIKILDITKRQLSYWILKGTKPKEKKTHRRSWRKFSIIDVFGFAVLKKLREVGINLHQWCDVTGFLQRNVHEPTGFIYNFAVGKPIYLGMDIAHNTLYLIAGRKFQQIQHYAESTLVMSLVPILMSLLTQTGKPDFYVKFECESGEMKNAIFYVNGERVEFERIFKDNKTEK